MSDKIFTIYGFGKVANYTAKDKRTRQRSAHQLTPYYILQGQTVRITLSGDDHGLVEAATGLPGMDSRQYYTLNRGVNTFQSRGNGILSFLNKNDYGQVTVEINSSPQRIPYFKLHHSTENSWKQEINTNLSAPVALLSSELADVVVSTKSARDNVVSASELMRDFDGFLKVQDDTLGVSKNGKADFRIDPNRNLHVEASSGYMFAANEYTGYVGTAAMQRLLRTNNRWGIWHENGHQRQQHAWQWNGGTGMTEVTVNIFSLMSQEKMVGQVTALTNYYPAIREFLSQEKKDFDAAPVDMKLGLFWQLRLAFGEGFYPQLHQRYRLMSTTPATSAAAQQKSLLIRTVSEVVNINMIPFFEKWGIEHDNATSKYLEHYPALEKPLWENTDQHYYTLEMPEKKYVPELIHLRKNITNIVLNSDEARFTLDDEWCMPFHYVIKKNGIFLAKIEAGKAYYCSLQIVRNKCNVSFIFNSNDRLQDNDIFEIEAHLNGEKHSLLQTSVNMMNLQSEIDALFSNADQTELHLNVTQEYLDALWHQTEKLSARYDVVIMLIKAQQILLERTLSNAAFANSFYEVVFSSSDFKKYTYQVSTGNHVIAEIVNGVPGMSSSLTNRTWKFSSNSISLNELNIQVSLHGYLFTLISDSKTESQLREKINALYLNKSSGILVEGVSQNVIDELSRSVNSAVMSASSKQRLLELLYQVQQIFLENTITSVSVSASRVVVAFRNADYRAQRYVIRANGTYVSEVNNGSAFYSSVSNNNWSTTVTAEQSANIIIEVRRTEKTYVVYQNVQTLNQIIYDNQGSFQDA